MEIYVYFDGGERLLKSKITHLGPGSPESGAWGGAWVIRLLLACAAWCVGWCAVITDWFYGARPGAWGGAWHGAQWFVARRVRGMVRSGLWLILGARHGAWGGAR